LISDLSLYDIQHTKGVGADLSHIETRAKVRAYVGKEELANALKGMDLVVIPAGVPRKPGICFFLLARKNNRLLFKV
jgi:malate dehydrogenase